MKRITFLLTFLVFAFGFAQQPSTVLQTSHNVEEQSRVVQYNGTPEMTIGDDGQMHVSNLAPAPYNRMPTTLATLFAGGNGGSFGGAVYFDITVGASDITITDMETHTAETGAFTMDVYAVAGTYVGNEANAGFWGSSVAVASGMAMGLGTPSPTTLDVPLVLSANTTYAIALVMDASHGHDYTNGDGTNEQYSNADVTIDLGSASNAPFTGPIFNPRVWNGSITYDLGGGGGGGCGAATYDNVTPAGNGAPSQLFPDFGNEGGESADDFVVTTAPGTLTTICEISVTGTVTAGGLPADPANEVILNVYDDAGGAPGTLIFTEVFDGPSTDPGNTGSFTLIPTVGPTLMGGNLYWVSVVVRMEFGVSGQWFWSTATDGNDGEFHWQDPTNLFGLGTCPTWGPGGTVCGVAGGSGPDLLMNISFEELPDNNECSGAFAIACGETLSGDTSDGNTDTNGDGAPDEWFAFTSTAGTTEVVTVSTCNQAGYDTILTVYDSCGGMIIAQNDDGPGCSGFTSELSFAADGSSTYYIAVDGFGGASGTFDLSISCALPPANDNCDGAIAIECGVPIFGTTINSTDDSAVAPDCDTPTTTEGVWYVYEDTTGLVTDILVSTCSANTDYDTKISVYTGDCANPPLTCVAGNDDSPNCTNFQSEVEFQSDGNTTYYIFVHGFGGQTGNFELNMTCTPVPPPNDMIVNSIDVDEIGVPYTDPAVAMPAATVENGNPVGCDISGGKGVWYNFTSAGNGTATAEIVSPAGNSFVVFFTAPDENAIETDLEYFFQIGNQCAPGTVANINTAAGTVYYVYVVNDGGITDITIDGTLLSTNDNVIEGFSFYPNPTTGSLNLDSINTIEDVAIYNLLGQQVLGQSVDATSAQLDTSSLSTGAYLMKVTVDGQTGTYKVIKR